MTKVDKLQRLLPLRGVCRHFLGKDNNLNQEGRSLQDTTCSTNMASFLAAVTLEDEGFASRLCWISLGIVTMIRPRNRDRRQSRKGHQWCYPRLVNEIEWRDFFVVNQIAWFQQVQYEQQTSSDEMTQKSVFDRIAGFHIDGLQSIQGSPFFTHWHLTHLPFFMQGQQRELD